MCLSVHPSPFYQTGFVISLTLLHAYCTVLYCAVLHCDVWSLAGMQLSEWLPWLAPEFQFRDRQASAAKKATVLYCTVQYCKMAEPSENPVHRKLHGTVIRGCVATLVGSGVSGPVLLRRPLYCTAERKWWDKSNLPGGKYKTTWYKS